MYQYDSFDQKIVNERAAQFRGQVERRLSGEITELEFKPLRLQNGLYMQLHGYMLRVAVPYGLLNSTQVRKLAHIARVYDRGYAHMTTRQNVQYNWLKLTDVPKILAELASVQMHGIQTSGNCVRNTTSDPFAGVAPDELEDPRPYCELIRQWSTFHPEFAFLPRKFKIAVTGTPDFDRAAIRFHDIGVRIVQNAAGERGFEIWAGGGMGRTPFVAQVVGAFVPYAHLLSYIEAILRVYNMHGRRDNKYKARIKILVSELGIEKFRAEVEKEFAFMKDTAMQVTQTEIDRIAQYFKRPDYPKVENPEPLTRKIEAASLGADRLYGAWMTNNIRPHREPGYCAVVLSLKTQGVPPGDASDTQLDRVADLADKFSMSHVVVTYAQNLVFPNVAIAQLPELYQALKALDMATPNVDLASDIICCPGLDYCTLANARSIPIAMALGERLDNLDFLNDIGPCSIKISGCINACGHHHVGNIGILGIDKHGDEAYQLMLGGCESDSASIGKVLGPALSEGAVVVAVESILKHYLQLRNDPEETFLQCYRRVGAGPFKEAAYATH